MPSRTIHYAELISTIAVVISLVFVGLELRHSNSLSEAEAVWRLNESYNQRNLTAAGNFELSELLARVYAGESEFDEGEDVSLHFWWMGAINDWEAAWATYDRGIIDLASLRGYMDSACMDMAANPMLASTWEQQKAIFAARFVKYVERHCDSLD